MKPVLAAICAVAAHVLALVSNIVMVWSLAPFLAPDAPAIDLGRFIFNVSIRTIAIPVIGLAVVAPTAFAAIHLGKTRRFAFCGIAAILLTLASALIGLAYTMYGWRNVSLTRWMT